MGGADPGKPKRQVSSLALDMLEGAQAAAPRCLSQLLGFSESLQKCLTLSAKQKGNFEDKIKVDKACYEREMKGPLAWPSG